MLGESPEAVRLGFTGVNGDLWPCIPFFLEDSGVPGLDDVVPLVGVSTLRL